jgi:hypothetical protein
MVGSIVRKAMCQKSNCRLCNGALEVVVLCEICQNRRGDTHEYSQLLIIFC